MDKNLFNETVFMPDLVRQFDEMISRSPDAMSPRSEIKHKAIIGQLFKAYKEV